MAEGGWGDMERRKEGEVAGVDKLAKLVGQVRDRKYGLVRALRRRRSEGRCNGGCSCSCSCSCGSGSHFGV